jgi:hypothetical protein
MFLAIAVAVGAGEDGGNRGESGGGLPIFPAVALFRSGDGWVVRDNNTERPDGYVVTRDSGASFVIDDTAESGLTLKIIGNRPYVSYP